MSMSVSKQQIHGPCLCLCECYVWVDLAISLTHSLRYRASRIMLDKARAVLADFKALRNDYVIP